MGNDNSNEPIISCRDVNKWFGNFHVLKDVNLEVQPQEVVVIIGPSGSGKSTFIRCINRLEEHQEGQIIVDGIELSHDVRNIAAIRSEIGMVFQQFNLFPHLTVMQNVSLAPRYVRRQPRRNAEESALQLLARVGIPEQAHKYPGQLSGGQQQRVAIARALVNAPSILMADEPTGNLDTRTSREVIEILRRLNEEEGLTIVLVTHDQDIGRHAKRTLVLRDGLIVRDTTDFAESLAALHARDEDERPVEQESTSQRVVPPPHILREAVREDAHPKHAD